MQSKMISQPIFFVSEELEKEKARYYDMLNGVVGESPNWGEWILFFLRYIKNNNKSVFTKWRLQ